MSAEPKRQIFRGKALEQYALSRERTILPRLVAPPVFAFLWVLLAILVVAGIAAWLGTIPVFATGNGVIITQHVEATPAKDEPVAIIFLSTTVTANLHTGLPVLVQVGESGPQYNGVVNAVEPGVLSPEAIREKYSVGVLEPSRVILVNLGNALSSNTYAGTLISAQVQTGSRRLLSLFPVFDTLLKDG